MKFPRKLVLFTKNFVNVCCSQKERGTSTNVQQHKSKAGKKGEKLVERATSKKSKSRGSSSRDPSSHGSDLVACDTIQVDHGAKSQQSCKQAELSTTCRPKRKPNKRNKYSHLALAARRDDVSIAANLEHVVTGSGEEHHERTLKQTGAGKVTNGQPCRDLESNSETLKTKKKRRKAKRRISDEAKDSTLETVTGDASSSPKKRKACDARVNADAISTGDASIGSVSVTTNRKRKRAAGDVKCLTRVEASPKITLDKTSANSPPANECVKVKVKASTPSAVTSEKRKIQCCFNIAKLKSVFQHQAPVSTDTPNVSPSKGDVSRDVQENAAPSKCDGNVPKKRSSPQSLRDRMQVRKHSIDRYSGSCETLKSVNHFPCG